MASNEARDRHESAALLEQIRHQAGLPLYGLFVKFLDKEYELSKERLVSGDNENHLSLKGEARCLRDLLRKLKATK